MHRFMNKFQEMPSGCWEWQKGKSSAGYGAFSFKGKNIQAHRFAYEAFTGEIKEGLSVCHKCDNPPCVNPAHLFLGTHTDNMQDKFKKGRANMPVGEKIWTSKITRKDVLKIRKLYERKKHTQKMIAEEFGLSQSHVSFIILNKGWKHVT